MVLATFYSSNLSASLKPAAHALIMPSLRTAINQAKAENFPQNKAEGHSTLDRIGVRTPLEFNSIDHRAAATKTLHKLQALTLQNATPEIPAYKKDTMITDGVYGAGL
jgi:hypothetical protein